MLKLFDRIPFLYTIYCVLDHFYSGENAQKSTGDYNRITNARAEGINSKIALIEKMAYGFRNKEHLKTAIYFRCGNLQLYP